MHRTPLRFAVVFSAFAAALLLAPLPGEGQRASRLERQTVNGRDVVAREALVRFRDGIGPPGLADVRAETDAQVVQRVGRAGAVLIRSRSFGAADLVERLARRPDVVYAEPNFIIQVLTTPNDPHYGELWGFDFIQAPAAWDVSVGSTSNVVAVIDTGIDYTHPDLAANMWSAPAAFSVNVGGQTITCAAGSHGFNAITRTCDPMDEHHHGTHVAGTIGAVGANGVGVVGVNWTAQLMGIKFLDASGSGSMADAIASMEFAMAVKQAFAATGAANVRVLSNSWGAREFSQALFDEVSAANGEDMLVVAGSGNDGFDNDILPFYPASFDAPNVVAVGATSFTDDLAWFSNYGASSVDLAAPGDFILSTTPGNSYEYLSGTSMATPHVSGAAALVLSQCALDTAALKDTLLGTVDLRPSLKGSTVTGGRLNVSSALHACTALPETPVLTARGGDTRVTLSWPSALGAIRYNVKRSLSAGGPYTPLISDIKTTTYVDAAVVNGTTYYYVVWAENTLGDSGDSNEAAATPAIPSDLVVSSFTAPAIAGEDSTIAVSVTTKNQGPGIARSSATRFYLSTDTVLDAFDTVFTGAQSVGELASGATISASVSIDIPAGVATGKRYLIAQADADDVLDEGSETNNRSARAIQIGPDLLISAFTVPSAAAAGGTISVTDTVRNQGGGTADASSTTFYLSLNTTIGAGDVLLGSRSVLSVVAGATNVGTTVLTIPSTTTVGAYNLLANADGNGVVLETTETNNASSRAIQIGGDLIISALTVPAAGGAGSTIVVTDTTKNNGGGSVAASVTRFYLSANWQLDSADVLLAGSREVSTLAPGVISSGSTSVAIPAATTPGSYYVIGKADADGAVPETYETNNTFGRMIQIGSDLVISTLTLPAQAGAGSTITVNETTKNQGAGLATPSVTRFYLSANAVLDGGDVLLAGLRQIPELAGAASNSGPTQLTIPAATAAATYYIIAKADGNNGLPETSEANNALPRLIRIGGDLVVSAFTVPAKGGAGIPIAVSDTTTNQGSGSVGASVTKIYLSSNATFDVGDTLLGARAIPELLAGAGSSGPTTVTIPSNVAAGTYYIIAAADADAAAAETQETNNNFARTIQIGGDLWVTTVTAPARAAAGSPVVISDTTANQGAGDSTASVTTFYLSVNSSIGAGDVVLDGSRTVSPLAPGTSSAGSTTITIPAGTAAGTFYLIAKADGDNTVGETQEANNTRSRTIIVGPDLIVSAVTTSSTSVAAGTAVNVTDTVMNLGAEAALPSVTRFYLSKNGSVDATDIPVEATRTVPEIDSGASNSGTTTLTIPASTPPGAYYLLANADGNRTVSEALETNNVIARYIQVTTAP